jgi:hypothetical protein
MGIPKSLFFLAALWGRAIKTRGKHIHAKFYIFQEESANYLDIDFLFRCSYSYKYSNFNIDAGLECPTFQVNKFFVVYMKFQCILICYLAL